MNDIQALITFIKNGGDINQIVNQLANNNPMIKKLLQISKGNPQAIETFTRNVCKEKGIDFDKEYNEFINQIKNI